MSNCFLELYTDDCHLCSEARYLLKKFGFKYLDIKAVGSRLPLVINHGLHFQGLSGIKRFIWLRTPLLYRKPIRELVI